MSCQLAEIISKLFGVYTDCRHELECTHRAQVCRKGLNDTRRFLLYSGWGIRLAVCMRVVESRSVVAYLRADGIMRK
jgi:hypothetical protein